MGEEIREYITFSVRTSDGGEAELAVVDTFEFGNREYVAAARVLDDSVDEESIYIYRLSKGKDFAVEKITSAHEYREVSEAYLEMEENDENESE